MVQEAARPPKSSNKPPTEEACFNVGPAAADPAASLVAAPTFKMRELGTNAAPRILLVLQPTSLSYAALATVAEN